MSKIIIICGIIFLILIISLSFMIFNKKKVTTKNINWCFEDNKCIQRTGCPQENISSSQGDCESKI